MVFFNLVQVVQYHLRNFNQWLRFYRGQEHAGLEEGIKVNGSLQPGEFVVPGCDDDPIILRITALSIS